MHNMAERNTIDSVVALIESILKIPADQVDIDANLESFGINSLIIMELMDSIEEAFDVTLTPAQFSDIDSVRGVAALVDGLMVHDTGAQPNIIPLPAAENKPVAVSRPAKSDTRDATLPQQLFQQVGEKYAIDLKPQKVKTLEAMADALIENHSAELIRYYGLRASNDHAVKAQDDIAIIGMGCRLPDAPDYQTLWANMQAQKNSVREIPQSRWSWEDHYDAVPSPGKTLSKWGALLEDVDCFDADFFHISPEDAATMDPQLRLLIEETYHGIEDAGINIATLKGSRTGVFIGYEYAEYEHYLRRNNNKDLAYIPVFSSSSPSYYLANRISNAFDFCGPSESFNVNCASSAVAINRAYYSLLNNECDLAIVGAASLNLFADDYISASQYGVLSPDGTSGVFDDNANGFTRGEGIGVIVLRRRTAAENNNNRIYGLIKTVHESYRGATRNISEVKHEAITRVLQECYQKGAIAPESISYIEVDGYANKWADSFEYEGIKGAFAADTAGHKHVALGSIKGNIGNVEPVSGLVSTIKLALSLHHKVFPATISKKKINSFMDVEKPSHPLYIADREIPFDTLRQTSGSPVRAGINSFADSGSNVHIVLEEYLPQSRVNTGRAGVKQLVILSARDTQNLEKYVQRYIDFLSGAGSSVPLIDIAYTSQVGREALQERLAVVASDCEDLLAKLMLVATSGLNARSQLEAKEIYYSTNQQVANNPLAKLITEDMIHTQLMQNWQASEWKHISQLWVNGVSVPWQIIWQDNPAQRISLPGYPFAKNRYWIDIGVQNARDVSMVVNTLVPQQQPPAAASEENPWYFYIPANGGDEPENRAMASEDKIALFMVQDIARQLKCAQEDVARDKNLFDLGMASIGVAQLVMKMDELLATSLPLNVLFTYSNVNSLSGYLAQAFAERLDATVVSRIEPAKEAIKPPEEEPAAGPEPVAVDPAASVVALRRTGKKAAIFAVPGAGGHALSLQLLSQALGSAQPFYCLDPVGLAGDTSPMNNVRQIAAFNLAAMKSVQPQGPYRLLGYSNGGIVAFDMAQQLHEQGEKVTSLVLLDTLSPQWLGKDPVENMMVGVFNRLVSMMGKNSDLNVAELAQISPQQRGQFFYQRVTELGIVLPQKQFIATLNVALENELACRAYQPEKLSQAVNPLLLRATQGYVDMPADYGWNSLFCDTVKSYDISANHFTLLEKEHIKAVVKILNNVAKKSVR